MKLRTTYYKLRTNQGFTLIELVVVIFIIALISSMSLSNFRAGEKQKRATIAAETVVTAFRNAQNLTFVGRNINSSNSACRDPAYYTLTVNYSGSIVLSAMNNNTSVCGSTPTQIESYSLPAATRIKADGMTVDTTAVTSTLALNFYLPYGTVKASIDGGVFTDFSNASIFTETNDSSFTKNIFYYAASGKIDF